MINFLQFTGIPAYHLFRPDSILMFVFNKNQKELKTSTQNNQEIKQDDNTTPSCCPGSPQNNQEIQQDSITKTSCCPE